MMHYTENRKASFSKRSNVIFTFFPVHKSFPNLEPGFTDLRLGRHHPFYQRLDILFFVFPWVASTLTEKKNSESQLFLRVQGE